MQIKLPIPFKKWNGQLNPIHLLSTRYYFQLIPHFFSHDRDMSLVCVFRAGNLAELFDKIQIKLTILVNVQAVRHSMATNAVSKQTLQPQELLVGQGVHTVRDI